MKTVYLQQLANYEIIVPIDIDECTAFSAEKLAEYINKVTKVVLPIVNRPSNKLYFSVGNTATVTDEKYSELCVGLEDDGFSISEENNCVYFAAVTERGLMYSVFEYIEKFLGVKFLTATCEYVPCNSSINLPDVRSISNPDFPMRTYLVGDTFQDNADMTHLARTRVKDLFTPIGKPYGGEVPVYGRNFNHNFHFYVPFEKYGNEHPEFYRFVYVNEKSLPTIDITNGITDDGEIDESMDVSVAKIVVQELKKDALNNPSVQVLNFTQEDGIYYYDSERNRQHEKKYKRSGILIRFCNAVIKRLNLELKPHNKTIKLMTFAYDYAKEAPTKIEDGKLVPIDSTVVADPNLIVQLALFANGAYDYFSKKQPEFIKKALSEWQIICGNLWFWGYDIDFHRYLGYFDSFSNIDANVRGFKAIGIKYLCMQGSHDSVNNWQCNMRAYVYRKMMWDITLSSQSLLDEYITLYYGIAADYIKKFMNLFHQHYVKCLKQDKYTVANSFGQCANAENNPPELLYSAIKIIENAIDFVKSSCLADKECLIKKLKAVQSTPLMVLYDNFYFYYEEATIEQYQQIECQFFDVAACGGVDTIGEKWSLQQYKQEGSKSTKKFV